MRGVLVTTGAGHGNLPPSIHCGDLKTPYYEGIIHGWLAIGTGARWPHAAAQFGEEPVLNA